MIILGLHLATLPVSIALTQDDRVLHSQFLEGGHEVSEGIVSSIGLMLQSCGVSFKDLDGVAVTTGPGSYTGLRLAVTVANTLGYALKIPVFSMSTLEAFLVQSDCRDGAFIVTCPARKHEFNVGRYTVDAAGAIEVHEEFLIASDAFSAYLEAHPDCVHVESMPLLAETMCKRVPKEIKSAFSAVVPRYSYTPLFKKWDEAPKS